jgi:hypothetical protein
LTTRPNTTASSTSVTYPGTRPDFDPAHFTEHLSAANAATLAASAIPLDDAVHDIGIWTATKPDDLPDDLKDYTFALPGTVFPLRSVDGSVVYQNRRDSTAPAKPGQKVAKYLQPKDTGSLVTVHPNQLTRIGTATDIWIVEGTKQGVCACYYAPEDVLVLAIQGCTGWMSEGTGVPDLGQIVVDGAKVTIFFDADRTTKRGVWHAGANLGAYLTNLDAGSVAYAARADRATWAWTTCSPSCRSSVVQRSWPTWPRTPRPSLVDAHRHR